VGLPLAIIVALLAILVPIGFATDDGPAKAPGVAPTATIARRVETIRHLRFRTIPKAVHVTGAQARREGLADFERSEPPAAQRAEEALYTLLGLYPPGTDVRRLNASIFGDQVAGYYDPRSKRLRIVDNAGTASRVLDEDTLAHELDHALEDQAIGLDERLAERTGDGALAYTALIEGSATVVMFAYLDRYFDSGEALGGLLGSAFAIPSTNELPPFVVAGLLFPYEAGEAFVTHLLQRAGGRWTLVDLAERTRRPASTEQILHPEKWIRAEMPDRVRLPRVRAALGPGWRRLTAGTFGEWQTGQMLLHSGRPAAAAAAGWGGDHYELWRRGDGPCSTPCRSRDALVMRWRWDTAADARQFDAALRGELRNALHAVTAIRTTQRTTTLALAPERALAAALVR
jgi:hypothetical protein